MAETQISVSLLQIIRQTMKTRHEIAVPNQHLCFGIIYVTCEGLMMLQNAVQRKF